MNRPMIRIHNSATNEIIDREMNDEEFAQWQNDLAEAETKIQLELETARKKQALLDKLGITEEEAKLLLS